MAISPDNDKYMISGSEDETFIVWERTKGEKSPKSKDYKNQEDNVQDFYD